MVDVDILVAKFLRSSSTLTGLLPARNGTNSIYTSDLPEGFNPDKDGPGIVITANGGQSNSELSKIAHRRLQIRVWDGVNQYKRANQVYNALFDWCHQNDNVSFGSDGFLMSIFEVVPPQDITDPDTQWVTVVSFYEVFARS